MAKQVAVTAPVGFGNSFFGGIAASFKTRMARQKVFRQTYNELSSLNDRELSDLGMSRSNIRSIAWEAAQEAA